MAQTAEPTVQPEPAPADDFASGARMIAAMEQAAPPSAAVVSDGDIDPTEIPF